MSEESLTCFQLLNGLRTAAKRMARADKTKSYNQHLNELCKQHGYNTFSSFKRAIDDRRRRAEVEADDALWATRLAESLVWGTLDPIGPELYTETLPLPCVGAGAVPWPNLWCGSGLFSAAEGARRRCDGPVFSLENKPMWFKGEELRKGPDMFLMMHLFTLAKNIPCGQLIEFSLAKLEAAADGRLFSLGKPITVQEIERSLWRLSHGLLTVKAHNFLESPLLVYADCRRAPDQYRIRLHPKLLNFFYPPFLLF